MDLNDCIQWLGVKQRSGQPGALSPFAGLIQGQSDYRNIKRLGQLTSAPCHVSLELSVNALLISAVSVWGVTDCQLTRVAL